ncbi:hypothetical protein Tco_0328291 [Tanacetum coccineum]
MKTTKLEVGIVVVKVMAGFSGAVVTQVVAIGVAAVRSFLQESGFLHSLKLDVFYVFLTIPGSVQSLDLLDRHSDIGAGMLILFLDPQILWSSLKQSLVQSWHPL